MTAISLARDPVVQITSRIEQGRERLRRERAAETPYMVFDDGRLVGAVYGTPGSPAFGPAAPAVLLRREVSGLHLHYDLPHLPPLLQPLDGFGPLR